MPKSFGRNERVAASVRREVSDIILNEIKDPRVKKATVTEVSVSPDLRNARIYISFLTDSEDDIKSAMEGLQSAQGFVRSALASRLKLRYMPNIHFIFDKLLSESMKLDALIAKGLGRAD
ncbi:Ribosome-binding factor A [Anaerobiospirillum thomasii]|uniref:Ribosome-binding factor A n=1 Tax=Anaerobiospirillum thomasii TaxID=179995 RepID=A0A2X0V5N4_9GAMM|nr:30S ribosome-binding factor RbfA [Anaerobiospirillum thomasii]SPT68396.1 Ribosome-binding factor A [Anaerobiospirillum thomasii]SPT70901.1 Ribosome-binding factor A [Anaerobiospirillum thomasii]